MAQPTPDVPAQTFRDTAHSMSPWWMRGFIFLRVIYAIFLHFDVLGEMLIQGVRRRWPGLDAFDSLGVIGRDRRIRRGRNETNAVYATRLARWLDDHRRRGGPYALLAQLAAHYADAPFEIDLLYGSTFGYFMPTGFASTYRTTVGGFVPDTEVAAKPGRYWLFYHWPIDPGNDGEWGDPGTWDDGGVWDSGLTAAEVTDLRLVPNEWGNGHSRGIIVLLPPGKAPQDYTTAGPMVRLDVEL